jgi:hypothetical protein
MFQHRRALATAFAILFGPLALPLALWRILPFGDLGDFHVPMRFLYRQALLSGSSMLWSPALGSGVYLHAEGQSGMAHPFHLLIYRFLPLTAAINIEMLASYIAALAGMFLFLRHLSLRRDAAAAGALLFAFSGFQLLHLNHLNLVAVTAHIPWLLYAADLVMTTPERRRRAVAFAAVGLILGSEFLLGFPQGVWVNGVALGWLLVYRLATGSPASGAVLVGVAATAGILIGGAQLLPTVDAVRTSVRAATTPDFRVTFSLHPFNLLQLFSPYVFSSRIYAPMKDEWFVHEFCVYNGALSTLCLFWIATRWKAIPHRRLATGLLCLAAVALVLSLGRYGGIYPVLANVPGLSGLRAPARHIVLLHFALAGLAAIALEDAFALAAGERTVSVLRLWPLAIPVVAGVAIEIAVGVMSRSNWAGGMDLRLRPVTPALAGIATAVGSAALLAACAMRARWAAPLLIVLTAIDLAAWGTRYVYSEAPTKISALTPAAGVPPGRSGDLVYAQQVLTDTNKFPLHGFHSSTAYLGLVRSSALDADSAAVQRIAGVQWYWTSSGWARRDGALARARLVTQTRVSTHPAADLRGIDAAVTALVDAPVQPLSGTPGTATIVRDDPGNILIRTQAPATQLLIVAERFHDGWQGECDAAAIAILPVYGDYIGVVVPAGMHDVRLSFAPSSFRAGLWTTVAGLGLLMASAIAVASTRGDPSPGDAGLRKARISSPRRMYRVSSSR